MSARGRLLVAASTSRINAVYEATGVAELCEAAAAPKGGFYHWWPSKQRWHLRCSTDSGSGLVSTCSSQPSGREDRSSVERLPHDIERLALSPSVGPWDVP